MTAHPHEGLQGVDLSGCLRCWTLLPVLQSRANARMGPTLGHRDSAHPAIEGGGWCPVHAARPYDLFTRLIP